MVLCFLFVCFCFCGAGDEQPWHLLELCLSIATETTCFELGQFLSFSFPLINRDDNNNNNNIESILQSLSYVLVKKKGSEAKMPEFKSFPGMNTCDLGQAT